MRAWGVLLAGAAVLPGMATAAPVQSAEPAPPAGQAPIGQAPGEVPTEDDENSADLVVTGRRLPGSVPGDIPPEETLSPADIRSYGVSSVADLLAELSPQTRSGRGSGGAPVVLLNGQRIASFSEIRDLPTEAIQRVEILPEEVALKYGFRADQRVVNIVLRPRFRATTVELDDRIATDGGGNQPEAELDWLRINRAGRTSLHLEYTQASALTEAERDIVQGNTNAAVGGNVSSIGGVALDPALGGATTVGVPAVAATRAPTLADFTTATNATDQSAYRTLLPFTRSFQVNGVHARTVFGNVGATLNARLEHNISEADRGLPSATFDLPGGSPFSPFAQPVRVTRAFDELDPLGQRIISTDAHLGATLNGDQGRWRWTVTANLDHARSDTRTDIGIETNTFQMRLTALDPDANPYAAIPLASAPDNLGSSRATTVALNTLVSGPVIALPAGEANTSITIGTTLSDFSSETRRLGLVQSAGISRDIGNAQVNLDLPIASRSRGVLSAIGDFSLNGNVAADNLSDFGTLWTIGYGANWSPVKGVRILASVTDEENAPSAQQLGNPVVTTPGGRVFDYVTGTTATVTTVTGGNPALRSEDRRVAKVGLTLKPWTSRDLTLTANYVTSRSDDAIAAFPAASAAIEAAFPTRFVRDAAGTLLRVDTRPINFARSERSELRYGFNLSVPVKSAIQRQMEAFRAGTGPNPFEGLRPPGSGRRPTEENSGNQSRGGNDDRAGGARDTTGAPAAGGDAAGGASSGGGFGGRGFGGGGRGFGRFGGGQAGGRVQFALYHTWQFTNRVTIADGGPVLDLLGGDATGSSGGAPRHELEGQAGYANNGLGARASLNFQSGTRVNGGTAAAPETLDFGSLTTLNLRFFADPGQRLDLVRRHPWLRGTRATLSVDNLFNQRQRVTDQAGAVPIGFQPAYLDPLGRTVRLSVRKLFF